MAFSVDELTKKLSLKDIERKISVDIPSNLSSREKKELLEEIGDYVKTAMLDLIGDGRSPVNGRQWKKLSKDYAKTKGSKEANMDLNGDMLDALDYKVFKGELYVGWFDDEQAAKAYGHTTGMKGHPWLDGVAPVRKLIPNEKENFTSEINSGIEMVVKEFLDARES
jgi:hypothetical protein